MTMQTDDAEEWRTISAFPGYSVSNLGRVRRDAAGPGANPGRILKPVSNGYGYLILSLKRKHMKVHRLVAFAFLDQADGKNFVNHIDGVKTNNRADNLEWATRIENARHAAVNGLMRSGSRHTNSKLSESDVEWIRMWRAKGFTFKRISDPFGVHRNTIADVCGCNGRTQTWKQVN